MSTPAQMSPWTPAIWVEVVFIPALANPTRVYMIHSLTRGMHGLVPSWEIDSISALSVTVEGIGLLHWDSVNEGEIEEMGNYWLTESKYLEEAIAPSEALTWWLDGNGEGCGGVFPFLHVLSILTWCQVISNVAFLGSGECIASSHLTSPNWWPYPGKWNTWPTSIHTSSLEPQRSPTETSGPWEDNGESGWW